MSITNNTEQKHRTTLEIDGQPLTVTGRIDRIDFHRELGYSILDYKTADTAKSPEETHRKGPKANKVWTDLQLPLYRKLVEAAGITGPVTLGYVQLSKEPTKLACVDWQPEDLRSADAQIHQVVRAVRSEKFWPPTDTPRYTDEFWAVCLDGCPDRPHALALSEKALNHTGAGP